MHNTIYKHALYVPRYILVYKLPMLPKQVEGEIQEEWSLIARDIYAFYPLLIKYVDLQRTHWIRNNVEDAEFLYNHVGEIFNLMNTSVVSWTV